jgi:glyoxylase-like metal-dependent hydrolase (beta-lactamase superfamily II)
MQLGDWRIDIASGGWHRADGGSMFGVVPKPLWDRLLKPDDRNRIPMATNCLVCRNGRHTVIVDTGYGGKNSEREQKNFSLEPGEPLVVSLAKLDLAPNQIDTVVFTHLHFDHAGGGTSPSAQGIVPAFPRARYFANRTEWETATSGIPELRASYPQENLAPLETAGVLTLTDGDVEILPGLRTMVTGGHTAGHQAIVLESGGQTLIYLADLCPTSHHMRSLWGMAFDLYPLDTRRQKPVFLGRAADLGWLVGWDHDPHVAIARIARDEKKEFAVTEVHEKPMGSPETS